MLIDCLRQAKKERHETRKAVIWKTTMYVLVILPAEVKGVEGYKEIPYANDILWSELYAYEEEASAIRESYHRCILWIQQKLRSSNGKKSPVQLILGEDSFCPEKMALFKTQSLRDGVRALRTKHELNSASFNQLVEEYARTSQRLSKAVGDEQKVLASWRIGGDADESGECRKKEILNSLHVKLSRGSSKLLKKHLLQKGVPVCLFKASDGVHCSVFCLSKDKDIVDSFIKETFPGEYQPQKSGLSFSGENTSEISTLLTQQLTEFFFCYAEAVFTQAYLESLQRYGPPGLLKYRLYECDRSRLEKTVTDIRKQIKKVFETPSLDDDDPGFTLMEIN